MLEALSPVSLVPLIAGLLFAPNAVAHVVEELPVVHCTVGIGHHPFALHLSVIPVALVDLIVSPAKLTFSVSLVVTEIAPVLATFFI